jgi:hypothetical protein
LLFAAKAGGEMAQVRLLPFARIALQVSRAVFPRYRSRFGKQQFNQPQLLAILCRIPYEDWTLPEAEVRLGGHRELRQALGLGSVPDSATLYRFLERLDDGTIDRARRDATPVARHAQKRTAASPRGGGCDGLGAGSGQHLLRAANASSRVKTAAVAALAEVGGRGRCWGGECRELRATKRGDDAEAGRGCFKTV